MPAMGDSVAEGTVLEWHKSEGDTVAADETIVEISTDKVDAEVPAPIAGTVVKIVAAEGDTVAVGAVLAEIAPGDGNGNGAPRVTARLPAATARSPPRSPCRDGAGARGGTASRDRADRRDRDPDGRRVGHRGDDPRVVGQGRRRGLRRRHGRRDLDRQGRHGASRADVRDDHRDPRGRRRHRQRRPGDRSDERQRGWSARRLGPEAGNGARRQRRAGAGAPTPRPADDANASPIARRVAAAEGVDLARRDRLRPRRPDHEGRRAGRRHAPDQRQRKRETSSRRVDPDQGLGRGARALHGREPLDPDRDLVPDAHRHDPGRPPQAAEGRRPEGLVHASDRVRDRAGGDRRDAGHGPPLRRGRRQAPPRRRRGGQPRPGRRRRAQGRRPHADGAGHPGRRADELQRSSWMRTTRSSRRRGRTR